MSRRGLLGLGLARLGDAVEPRPSRPSRPSRPARTLADVRGRWEEVSDPHALHALWRPAQDALREHAGHGTLVERAPASLPHDDGELDAALSLFGPQRTPDGRGAIRELFRVVRPGGRVGFAVWTAGSMTRMLRAVTAIDPAPPRVAECWAWGRRERLRQELDHVARDVAYRRVEVVVALDASAPLAHLARACPPLAAALLRRGARERLATALEAQADGTAATLAVPVLLVAARRT